MTRARFWWLPFCITTTSPTLSSLIHSKPILTTPPLAQLAVNGKLESVVAAQLPRPPVAPDTPEPGPETSRRNLAPTSLLVSGPLRADYRCPTPGPSLSLSLPPLICLPVELCH